MTFQIDKYKDLTNRIEAIKKEIITGKISILELELNELFHEMENYIDIVNLERYSISYKEVCEILEQKFEELKKLLRSLDDDKKIVKFLKNKPKDQEICGLFEGCWYKLFNIEDLSLKFLNYAFDRFCRENSVNKVIEHLNRIPSKEDFLIEIPEFQFIDRLDQYYNKIKEKLPCIFNDIFEGEINQIKIYEQFIYLLHLLQQGRLKYNKETNMLYL
ncbi:MAG: hypothetical protein ACFFKA_02535 [Candidatus Thorarchaeota archaeon]